MANKSSKSPSGEDREQRNEHIREQEVEKQDITANSGIAGSKPNARISRLIPVSQGRNPMQGRKTFKTEDMRKISLKIRSEVPAL
jgi:hypothetical protein